MGISKRYNVTVDDEFGKESDGDFSFMADGLAVTGTGFMTTETDDMKQLKKLYKQKREIKSDAAYIFILKKAKAEDGSEVAGDMPRSHQVGYVFSEDAKYSDAKTIAHELGHGLYSFEHTFENKGAKQGSTDNLMDYSDIADKMLKVWQWNLLYTHKNYTVPFLEDDEDAMWTTDGHYYFFTYLGMLMGLSFEDAEKYGIASEKPDTYILTKEDLSKGKIILGQNESIEFNDLEKCSSKVGDVIKGGYLNITSGKDYFMQNGKYYVLSSNAVEWPTHTITKEEYEKGYINIGYDIYGKERRLYFIRGVKEGDMFENITWLVGGLQQQYHALTAGYHGVELAATVYLIVKYQNDSKHKNDLYTYLLHRFGDSFAHFEMRNDKYGFNTSITLKNYIDALDVYFDKQLRHIIYDKNLKKDIERTGIVDIVVKTRLKREEIIWRMLQSVIRCSDDNELEDLDPKVYFTNSTFEYDDIRDSILTALNQTIGEHKQFKYDMYGKSGMIGGGSFTWGHSWLAGNFENGKTDDILRRKELFLYYAAKSIELYKLLGKGKNVNNSEIVKKIKKILDNAEKAANEIGETGLSSKLDAVFAFHIYLLRVHQAKEKGESIKSFKIPVKRLSSKIKESDAFVRPFYLMASDFQTFTTTFDKSSDLNPKAAIVAINFLKRYFYELDDYEIKKEIKGFKVDFQVTDYVITPIFNK